MDTYILMDCRSWECHDRIRNAVVDILYRNQIFREVRSFGDEIFVLSTTKDEHDVIAENILIDVPIERLKIVNWGRRYGRKTFDE